MKNYYEMLGITRGVPQEIISAVYKTWMHALKYHPDLGGDEELAKKINAAYEVLKDPKKRAEYDIGLGDKIPKENEYNRRSAPRYSVEARIACLDRDGKWHAATAKDVSAFGMRVRAGFVVENNDIISISFPNTQSYSIEVKVCWKRAIGNGEYEYGMKFFKPIADVMKRLGYREKE